MNRWRNSYGLVLILLAGLALFASCVPLEVPEIEVTPEVGLTVMETVEAEEVTPPAGQSVPIEATVTPTSAPTEDKFTIGKADVEQIEIVSMDVDPVQVTLIVQGQLADGCTEISTIMHQIDGNTIAFDISTQRPADALCTQSLVSFEETFPLDISNLGDGTYMVNINGATAQFMLAYGTVVAK